MKRVRWRHTEAIPRPDWVILGMPGPHGVAVYASTELDSAALQHQMDLEADDLYQLCGPVTSKPPKITLTVVMAGYVVIFAPDYATALVQLFESEWSPEPAPDQDHPAAVGQGPLQLEAGRG